MRTAIIAAGIGGSTLALSLLDTAIDMDIYESATAVKELGVGSNVLPHAVRELTEFGSLDALYGVGISTAEHVFYSSSTTSSCQLIATQPLWFEDGL